MYTYYKKFLLVMFMLIFSGCSNGQEQKVRPAGVAGGFYPEDPVELSSMIDNFLQAVPSQNINGEIFAIISPHAGYVYSGHVAAYGYAALKNQKIDRVIIISPSHLESFKGVSIYNGNAYATPLGKLLVDKEFAKKLSASNDLLRLSDDGHESVIQGRMEHALEVQLPFLQKVISEFKIVPIVMGDQQYESCRALGVSLAKLITDTQTIIVASSDLSHYHDYNSAVAMDKKVLNAIQEWDFFNLSRNLSSRIWEACGGGPIVATMIAAEKSGINSLKLLKYANSGDVDIGDKDKVVGYSSFAFYRSKKPEGLNASKFELTSKEQKELLKIARESVESIVKENDLIDANPSEFEALNQDRGAFVTLKKDGHLRGCIGYTSAVQPLNLTVRNAAASAAVKDYRFSPVKKDELAELKYEISVLSPFRLVTNINQIKIGKHGLFIKQGDVDGLLLPQVAEEYQWDIDTFLQHTCQKAGLHSDAWKNKDTDIFMFSAFVFGED
jgi:AmmeMemoRadiSam system protein B/AmmeMemoRadiSam system protein A